MLAAKQEVVDAAKQQLVGNTELLRQLQRRAGIAAAGEQGEVEAAFAAAIAEHEAKLRVAYAGVQRPLPPLLLPVWIRPLTAVRSSCPCQGSYNMSNASAAFMEQARGPRPAAVPLRPVGHVPCRAHVQGTTRSSLTARSCTSCMWPAPLAELASKGSSLGGARLLPPGGTAPPGGMLLAGHVTTCRPKAFAAGNQDVKAIQEDAFLPLPLPLPTVTSLRSRQTYVATVTQHRAQYSTQYQSLRWKFLLGIKNVHLNKILHTWRAP